MSSVSSTRLLAKCGSVHIRPCSLLLTRCHFKTPEKISLDKNCGHFSSLGVAVTSHADNNDNVPRSSGGGGLLNFKSDIKTETDSNNTTDLKSPSTEIKTTSKSKAINSIDSSLRSLASLPCTPLSLSDMYKYASWSSPQQRLRNAQFLHRELPIRIAQRTVDLLGLSYNLNSTRQVQNVTHKYLEYLQVFSEYPSPKNEKEEKKFTDMLESLILDRSSIPMAIASGVRSLKDERKGGHTLTDLKRIQELEEGLYRFFTARVGLRFLTEHHVLSAPYRKNKDWDLDKGNKVNFKGCIQQNCDAINELNKVIHQVTAMFTNKYNVCPEIKVINSKRMNNNLEEGNDFTYVPHHLRYMLMELLKNSCKATLKRHLQDQKPLQPIQVVVVKGKEDVTIKIADKGGGLPRSKMSKMWTFAHSTLDKDDDTLTPTNENNTITGKSIRGFGLPLSRIYARYFGGELTLKSMEGYGVDAYLYLPVLGVACENLPRKVKKSPGNLDSSVHIPDEVIEEWKNSDNWNGADDVVKMLDKLTKKAL